MLHNEFMAIVKEIIREILVAVKEALERRDLLYIFMLVLVIFSFTAGAIFALGMLLLLIHFFTALLKNTLGIFVVSALKLANGKNKNGKKEVQNEDKNMEKR